MLLKASKMTIRLAEIIFLLTFLVPCVAWSRSTTVRVKGNFASAFFSHEGASDPCISTFVSIDLFDLLEKSRSDVNPIMTALINILEFNSCTNQFLVNAFGSPTLTENEFTFCDDLSHALLDATVELFDFVSNSPIDFLITVEWNATGDLARQVQRSHIWTRGFIHNIHLNGLIRDAQGSDTISDGSKNFIPGGSELAIIGSEMVGQVEISN
jgi:hypothetical protein